MALLSEDRRYTVDGYRGIAFCFAGDDTAPTADTEWDGIEEPTGNVRMVMVGDDRVHIVDPGDVSPIVDEDYCSECGQIGCHADSQF